MTALAKRMRGKGSGGSAMALLHNQGVQFLISILVPGVLGCVICVWAFKRLARRYDWRIRITGS